MTAAGPRFVLPYQYVPGPTGSPLPGARMNFYLTGTSTRATTYSDEDLTVPNTNPVIADAYGMFGNIFLDPDVDYKGVLTDSLGAGGWTADPLMGSGGLASTVYFTQAGTAPLVQTVQERLRQSIFLTDYIGGVGDGSVATDDAWANALAQCATSGKDLFVPGTVNFYKVTAAIAVPAGVKIWGAGYTSRVRQVTVDENLFVPAGQNEFCFLHLQGCNANTVTDPFANHGIHCGDIENIKIHDNWFSLFYAAPTWFQETHNVAIQNNVFFQNNWPQTAYVATMASQSDITFYSATSGGRCIITGNQIYSDMSQAMFINAIGGDQDFLIAHNIIMPLDANWAPIASGASMNGRHGISCNYATQDITQNTKVLIQGNLIRYKKQTGIFCQTDDGLYTGAIIIDTNTISNVSLSASSGLGGGIRVVAGADGGGFLITNNQIHGVTQTNDAGIVVQTSIDDVRGARCTVSGNLLTGCLGFGITAYQRLEALDIINNQITGCGLSDINLEPTGAATVYDGRVRILGNRILRTNTAAYSILISGAEVLAGTFEIANNWIQGFDKTVNNATNSAILFSNANILAFNIHNNTFKEWYWGINSGGNFAAGRHFSDFVIDGNRFEDMNTGVGLSSGNDAVILVSNSTWSGVTNNIGVGSNGGARCLYEGIRVGNLILYSDTAIPTLGTWIDGDAVTYTSVAAAAAPGAVCTTPGASGVFVFKARAVLAA